MLSTTTKISEVFNYWIESSNSEGTKKAYGRIVPQFFQMLLGKNLQDVTKDDLESLVPLTVNKKYKEELSKNGIKNSTIINNLTVISGFFKQLEINKVFDGVNYAWIREVLLNTKRIKSDKVHRGNMSFKDYEDIKDWLSKYSFSDYALMCLVNTFGSIEIAGFSFSDKPVKRIGFSILFGVLALIPVYETFLKGN